MNSINQQQPEQNRKDLSGSEAIEQIKSVVDKAKSCFFCTTALDGQGRGARPMNIRKVDDQGNLWLLIANDSHTYQELSRSPDVELFFQGSPHSDFLHLTARASLSHDSARIADLWEPVLKTWFTQGQDDPRIAVVQVMPQTGYYWDTKHGNLVAGVKMMVGAVTGKTLDDSIEGTVKVGAR